MQILHDILFKRNIHGYTEEMRVQLWTTFIRQVPVLIVYYPFNEELNRDDVKSRGHYYVNMENAVRDIRKVYTAWQEDTDTVFMEDLIPEAITAIREAKEGDDGKMYRVVYENPIADISICALGSEPFNNDAPWFVRASGRDVGHWCIYPKHLATAIAQLYASVPYIDYVYDRLKNNPDGGMFLVQEANYHESGKPQGDDEWRNVDSYPHWCRNIKMSFTDDLYDTKCVYDPLVRRT